MNELTSYQKAALNYKNHISLTANAGSGKTFVLAKRYVEIALAENIPLNKMVAITFTDKAGGELYRKIASEIEQRLINENDNRKIEVLHRIRRQLVSANISTIHSFCINLLKSFPVEAGVDAGFVSADTNLADEIIDKSIEKYINDCVNNSEKFELLKKIIRFCGSKNNFIKQIKYLIGKRKKTESIIKIINNKTTVEIAEKFNNDFEYYGSLLLKEKADKLIRLLETINGYVAEKNSENEIAAKVVNKVKEYDNSDTFSKKMVILSEIIKEAATQQNTIKKRGYFSKDYDNTPEIGQANEMMCDFEKILPEENSFEAVPVLAEYNKDFAEIFTDILKIYENLKKHRCILDFEDILLYAENLLKNEEVKTALSERYNYIMIDEYQDTDEIQYNIFMPILDNLKRGNLFVVGDEKQSIYMFRDAEPEVFTKTREEITKWGKNNILNLPHTFRLFPEIAFFTNKLFSQLFKTENVLLNEVAYTELICARKTDEKGKVEILVCDENNPDIDEAEVTALKITENILDNQDLKFSDFAVLCRKRNHFAELEEAFSKRKIPYQIVGGKGFYQRQTVYDILNMLEFLLDIENDTALAGILRSPFFLLSDKTLYNISQKKGSSLHEKLCLLSSEMPELKSVVDTLAYFKSLVYQTEISRLIKIILNDTGYWSVIASSYEGDQEIANIKKLITLADGFYNQGLKSLYDFTDYLKMSVQKQEDEGQAVPIGNENTVKIMTIHQSKGLEFDTVFLYRTNDSPRSETTKAKSISASKTFGFMAKVPLGENYSDDYAAAPVVLLDDYIQWRKSKAEQQRLLYVAVTRAAKNLFICATLKKNRITSGSFFEHIAKGINLDTEKDEVLISGRMKFLNKDSLPENIEREIEQKIKLVKTFSLPAQDKFPEADLIKPELIITKPFIDFIKGDIISATKVAVYSQCPLKYHLAYNLGLKKLEKFYIKSESFNDFSDKEDDEKLPADLKGRIIHSLLENEAIDENLYETIKSKILGETGSEEIPRQFIDEIINDLKYYFNSNIYKEIKKAENYKNEFEIYAAEDENYLFGIIDKLIIEDKKIVIADYKTDKIEADEIKERAQSYEKQLKFYAYLVSKKYPEAENFALKLIFIKHPDNYWEQNLNKKEVKDFGREIGEIIGKINTNIFPANIIHCAKCYFAGKDKKCIYKAGI